VPFSPWDSQEYDEQKRQLGHELAVKYYGQTHKAAAQDMLSQKGVRPGMTNLRLDGKVPSYVSPTAVPPDVLKASTGLTLTRGRDYPSQSPYAFTMVADPARPSEDRLSTAWHEAKHIGQINSGADVGTDPRYNMVQDPNYIHFTDDQVGRQFMPEQTEAVRLMLERMKGRGPEFTPYVSDRQ
jgi:hypothetical protein